MLNAVICGTLFGTIDEMESKKKIFCVVCFLMAMLLIMGTAQAVTISDRSGGAIYWGVSM